MSCNTIAKNGDFVTFCPQIKNMGTSACPGTKGMLIIPNGLVYESHEVPSKGVFNTVDKIWQIGELQGGETLNMCFTLKVEDASQAPYEVAMQFVSSCFENGSSIAKCTVDRKAEPEVSCTSNVGIDPIGEEDDCETPKINVSINPIKIMS